MTTLHLPPHRRLLRAQRLAWAAHLRNDETALKKWALCCYILAFKAGK